MRLQPVVRQSNMFVSFADCCSPPALAADALKNIFDGPGAFPGSHQDIHELKKHMN